MTRTATRVAAAVGATVVMLGLATPALACTTTDAGGRSAAVSANQAKNDPGMVFHKAKDATPLTLAELQAKLDAKIGDKLTWLGAVQARVSASDRFSAEQKTAVLAHLQTSVDALTQLRADVAAATSVEGVRAVLMAADVKLFHHGFRNHGRHDGNRHHDGAFSGDRNQRNGGSDHHGFNGGGNDRGHLDGFQH
jgi:hypothetical protein